MNVFDALLDCEPRLTEATLSAFLRYAREISGRTEAFRESRDLAAPPARHDRRPTGVAAARGVAGG